MPPFVFLALLGLAFVRVDRFTVSTFLGAGSYFIATLTYAFVDGRFYLPLLFTFGSTRDFARRVGDIKGSQAAPFAFYRCGAGSIAAHLSRLPVTIRL